jgi:hypothetical protein
MFLLIYINFTVYYYIYVSIFLFTIIFFIHHKKKHVNKKIIQPAAR